jgi:aspartyl-tRNA(Asn)/glutamyl-tRNA(Gln) amidotransferase subunit A
VKVAFDEAMAAFGGLGAIVEVVSVPELDWVPAIAAAITTAEAAVLHGQRIRLEGARYGEAVRRRVESGLFISAATYVQAMRARVLFTERLSAVFQRYDFLALPTEPIPAPPVGIERMPIGGKDQSVRESLLRLTRICNIARIPAIAVPCGSSAEGLPLSLQLAAPAYQDARVIRAAHAYQQATDWHNRRPEIR